VYADSTLPALVSTLVRPGEGRVFLIYVIEVPRRYPVDAELSEETQRGERVLQQMEDILREAEVEVEADILQARDAGRAIVQEAVEKGVDLILLEVPYRRGRRGSPLGPTVLFVLEHAPCPVLLLRQPEAARTPVGQPPRAVEA
jgi:nucleotide-binding universal stress UspA family protein